MIFQEQTIGMIGFLIIVMGLCGDHGNGIIMGFPHTLHACKLAYSCIPKRPEPASSVSAAVVVGQSILWLTFYLSAIDF